MGSNQFGLCWKVTTWGESHGPAMGCVIDGCPAGLSLSEALIQPFLDRRAPGKTPWTSPRKEPDSVQILSGVFEGKTTGAPIALLIQNQDADSKPYEKTKGILKPGHAEATYRAKYGVFDFRGSGRASARETVARVAAGAVAELFLAQQGISIQTCLSQVGALKATDPLFETAFESPIFAADPLFEEKAMRSIASVLAEGDSVGGSVSFCLKGVPKGLGDPIYEKLEARLAYAMLSIPATKSFEIGEGVAAIAMKGSEHNDTPGKANENHAGGLLGGISTGLPIVGTVGFKPTSSIQKPQASQTIEGQEAVFQLPKGARHDPCVAIRAVPVVRAMCAWVLADAVLMQRLARLEGAWCD